MNYQKEYSSTKRNPGTAVALSFVPGLGQIYNLQPRKGLIFLTVGIANFTILAFLIMSKQIVNSIQSLSANFDLTPNSSIISTFSELGIESPSVVLIGLMFLAFILFAMRDAYDSAIVRTKRPIYASQILELSEANGASYLFHISLIISFFILALFFLAPSLPRQQITSIEFIQTDEKKIEKPVEAKDISSVNRVPKKKVNLDKNQFRRRKDVSQSKIQKQKQPITTSKQSFKVNPKPVKHVARPAQTINVPALPKVEAFSGQAPQSPLDSLKPTLNKSNSQSPLPDLSSIKPDSMPTKVAFAPVLTSGKIAPAVPSLHNSSSKNKNSALSPHIIPTSKMESGSSGIGKPKTLSRISGSNSSKKHSSKSSQPSPQSVGSNSNKGLKDLISIKPSLPRAQGNSRDDQIDSSNQGNDSKIATPRVKNPPQPNFQKYMLWLQRKIRQNWLPPKDARSKRVEVLFSINRDGTMANLKITRSSGSSMADQAALRAVRNSARFRPLPKYSPSSVDVKFTFDYNVFKSGSRAW